MVVEISAYPNTQITLSNEKNTYIKTTDEKGKAVFKGLKAGTYTAMCTVNGKQFTQSITLVDTIKAGLPSAQIKGLPLKSKIKLSNGIKMILMNKNLSGHPANSATFVSEYIVEDYPWDNPDFTDTTIVTKLMPKYYNTLTQDEKKTILQRKYKTKRLAYDDPTIQTLKEITAYFWLLSAFECGTSYGNKVPNDGTKINFTGNASRIKKYENGTAGKWYTRTSHWWQWDGGGNYWTYAVCVQNGGADVLDGNMAVGDGQYKIPTYGIVPACDISQDAYVALDSDGYYRILGMQKMGELETKEYSYFIGYDEDIFDVLNESSENENDY